MEAITEYEQFSSSKYYDPWVAEINHQTGRPDFSKKIGGYTGGRKTGDAGELYISEPKKYQLYMYGHKMIHKKYSWNHYIYWDGEQFVEIEKTEVSRTIKMLENLKSKTITL